MADNLQGRNLQEARRYFTSAPLAFTVNVTVTQLVAPIPLGVGLYRILGVHVVGDAIPADADGVMTLTVRVHDKSGADIDTIVAAQDLETLITVANEAFECTLAAEGAEDERTITAGDVIDMQLISDSAAIETNPNIVVIVEYIPLPRLPGDEDEFAEVRYEVEYNPQ